MNQETNTMHPEAAPEKDFSWPLFILMASITFMAMLSELAPSGVLPQIMEDLQITAASAGQLVGFYALASAICAIPLVSLTLSVNRKVLLQTLMIGFAVSNFVVAISSSYAVIMACRILGGICAGILWPMIAAYGMRLVPDRLSGRAIAVIMSGTTLGISLGIPAVTFIGETFNWRVEFTVIALVIAGIAVLCQMYLPSLEGEKLTKTNSPIAVFKNKGVLIVLALTLLGVMGHYSVYTYVTLLVRDTHFVGGIEFALILFGIGSIISVVLAARYIDAHLQAFIVIMLGSAALAMFLFVTFKGAALISHFAFFTWGLAFGPLVTMFQSAVSKQIDTAKDIATSIQSSTFNFAIIFATSIGGLFLSETIIDGQAHVVEGTIMRVVIFSMCCFIPATVIAFMAKKTLDR